MSVTFQRNLNPNHDLAKPLSRHPLLCISLSTFNMRTLSRLVFLGFSLVSVSQAARFSTPEVWSEMAYARSHSLGRDYSFHERGGWEPANISNPISFPRPLTRRSFPGSDTTNTSLGLSDAETSSLVSKRTKKPSITDTLVHAINSAWNGLRGSGNSEKVKITWYTGQDLQNPSCWPDPTWAPTVSR